MGSKLRRTKPIYRLLAVGLSVALCTLLILSIVAPLPEAYRILSIGTSETVLANPDWLSGWDQRVQITIDAGDVDSDLIWFPITLKLGTSVGINSEDVSFIFDEIGDNSKKIAITQSDEVTQLYVEVEAWNSTTEEAILHTSKTGWTVDDATNTTLYLYYDNDHADNTEYVGDPGSTAAQAVWDSNFKAVYHMDDGAIISGIGDFTTAVLKDTSTYDCFGTTLKTGTDTFLHFTRQGTGHVGDKGKIVGIPYDADADSWGDVYDVYVDGTYDSRNVGGGIIGTNIYLFFARYDYSTPVFHDIGYIKSTDLTGTSWGDYTPIGVSPLTVYSPHGNIVQVGSTYYQPFYGIASGTYYVKLFKSIDSGANWTVGATIYSGATAYTETAIGYIGGDKLIALARTDTNDYLYQFTSDDGGDSWDDAGATNLGDASSVSVPHIQVLGERILAVYSRDTTAKVYVSDSLASLVFSSPGSWAASTEIGACGSPMDIGMPSAQYWENDIWVFVWAYGVSASDVDTYVRQGTEQSTIGVIDSATGKAGSKVGVGEPAEASGAVGNAQAYDGDNDGITIADNADMSAMTSGITLECMVKASVAAEWQSLINKYSTSKREFALVVNNNAPTYARLRGVCYDESANAYIGREDQNNSSTLYDGNWHIVAMVYEGGTSSSNIIIYQDGAAADDANVQSGTFVAIEDLSANVFVGKANSDAGSVGFAGVMDEVRISDIGRAAAWIKATAESLEDDLLDWGSEEIFTVEITNTPDNYGFGILQIGTSSNTGISYFSINNTGNCNVDITIQGTNLTAGDDTWELSADASTGENIYGLHAGLDDDDDLFDTVVNLTANAFVTNLAEATTQDWGLNISMPDSLSGFDGNNMTGTITLIASEAA